jgi:hypothetical protein
MISPDSLPHDAAPQPGRSTKSDRIINTITSICASSDPDATARFFEMMFGAEVTRGVYPPGTLYPGQQRVTMRLVGQKVLIAPPHPREPNVSAPPFPNYGPEHIRLTVGDVDAAVAERVRKAPRS